MIECLECHRVFQSILHHSHLKTHSLTVAEYRVKFGLDTPLVNRSKQTWKSCATRRIKIVAHRDFEAVRDRTIAMWQRPGFREKHRERLLKAVNREGFQEKKATSLKAAWAESEARRRDVCEQMRKRMLDPKYRSAIHEAQERLKSNGGFKTGRMSKPHRLLKAALIAADLHSFISEQWVNHGMRCDEVDREHGVVIEVNGCWWHACPVCYPENPQVVYATVQRALQRHKEKKRFILETLGWNLLEVWEHEILSGAIPVVVDKVLKLVKKSE